MEYDLASGQLAKVLALTGVAVSAATIQRYAREGRIPSKLTPGGRYRFNLTEVQRALATPSSSVSLSRPRLTGGLGTGAAVIRSAAGALEAELRAHRSEPVDDAVGVQRSLSAAVRDQVEHAAARAVAFA